MPSGCGIYTLEVQMTKEELEEIKKYVSEYCRLFGGDESEIMSSPFTAVTPDSKNPYRQMYVAN